MSAERWLVIPRWRGTGDQRKTDGFQHFGDRDPIWIKNYTRLLRKDEYTGLTPPQRACLHGLWLLYASKRGEIRVSTASITRELGMRVTKTMLEALNHAGFIAFVDTKEIAIRYWIGTSYIEVEVEQDLQDLVEKTTSPVDNFPIPQFGIGGDVVDITEVPRKKINPDNRVRRRDSTSAYTGCKWVTGANGSGGTHIYDVLGIDFPPPEWPFAVPSTAEVLAELERRRVA